MRSRGSEPQAVTGPAVATPQALQDLQIDIGSFISRMSAQLLGSDDVIPALCIPIGLSSLVGVIVSVSRKRRKKKQQTSN